MSAAHDENSTASAERSSIDAMSKIEDEIEQHSKETHRVSKIIADLKTRRNSHLAIFRLPVEVLCRIFSFTQQSSPWDKAKSLALDLMSITQVCQYWRNAALNDPSLWTRPWLEYPKLLAIMLDRSQRAGLHIKIDSTMSMPPTAVPVLAPHISHTSEIVVRNESLGTVEQLLRALRSNSAPMLETLVINMITPRRPHPRLHPNSLLGTENLRHLYLSGIDFSWRSHLLSNLTTLSLCAVSNDAKPTPADFVDMLNRMRQIKSLSLYGVLPTRTLMQHHPVVVNQRIRLSNLERVHLFSEASECEFFWNIITTSTALKEVSMDVTFEASSDLPLPNLLESVYRANTSDNQLLNPRCLDLEIPYTPFPDVEIMARDEPLAEFGIPIGSGMSYSRGWGNSRSGHKFKVRARDRRQPPVYLNQPDSLLPDIFDKLHLGNLSELNLTSPGAVSATPNPSGTLARTFGTLASLRTVITDSSSAKFLVDALLINWDKDPATSPNSIAFPGLQHIVLRNVEFGGSGDPHIPSFLMGPFLDCLMNRYERGVDIHEISVNDCLGFTSRDLQLLREVVVDVEWHDEEEQVDSGNSAENDEDDDEEHEDWEEDSD